MPEKYCETDRKSHRWGFNLDEPIVSVNKWEDVKKVEEFEDCFILEFDPTKLGNAHHKNDDNDHDDDDDDDDIVISGSIVCVKRKEDVKMVEEFEDCFILEFDPTQQDSSFGVEFSKLRVSVKTEVFSDDDVEILGATGKVACKDYPHPRHLCAMYPFKKTLHQIHCKMCYCYVCDKSAPCKKWTGGCKDPSLKHCDATPDIFLWRWRRDRKMQRSRER